MLGSAGLPGRGLRGPPCCEGAAPGGPLDSCGHWLTWPASEQRCDVRGAAGRPSAGCDVYRGRRDTDWSDWDRDASEAESVGHQGNTPVEVQALPPGAGQAQCSTAEPTKEDQYSGADQGRTRTQSPVTLQGEQVCGDGR